MIANAEAARFIVTSRPAAAEEGWLREEGFADSLLQPMEPQQIEALVDQWHIAARKQTTDEDVLTNLDSYRDSLKGVIRSDRAIRNLATTPLLCAMLCLLNVDRRTMIPKDRMALYRIGLETLARREAERETDRASALELTERQRELALEELAAWLIRNDRSDATRVETEGVVADKLPQFADRRQKVVQYLLERSGLLREPVIDRIDFIHRTFQEYLAAKRVVAAHDIPFLLSHAHEPAWREVVILATGHASDGCEMILKGLLERADREPEHRHYLSLLAVSCLETATRFSEETQRAIQARLAELVPPKNITEAKALASAGELALPYLGNHQRANGQQVAACVRTLSLIGTDQALRIMARYASDTRQRVVDELLSAVLDLDDGRKQILTLMRPISCRAPKRIVHLSPVADLTTLHSLDLSRTRVTDLAPLANLTALRSLNLAGCTGVTDLNPLTGLTELRRLSLTWCSNVKDLTPLAGLGKLQSLNLRGCRGVIGLIPLAGMTTLHTLDLSHTHVSVANLTLLADLTKLQSLYLRGCRGVTDLIPLAGLTALQSLDLGETAAVDLSPLAGLSNLQSLNLDDCPDVIDLTPLAGLTALQSLYLSRTPVTDLTPLAGLTKLRVLSLSQTPVADLAPIAGLNTLEALFLARCTAVVDLAPLVGLLSLKQVFISNQLRPQVPPELRARIREISSS